MRYAREMQILSRHIPVLQDKLLKRIPFQLVCELVIFLRRQDEDRGCDALIVCVCRPRRVRADDCVDEWGLQ